MKWEKAWAYLTSSHVAVREATAELGASVGGATVHQHSTDQLPFGGHGCHGWGGKLPSVAVF